MARVSILWLVNIGLVMMGIPMVELKVFFILTWSVTAGGILVVPDVMGHVSAFSTGYYFGIILGGRIVNIVMKYWLVIARQHGGTVSLICAVSFLKMTLGWNVIRG